MAVEKPDHIRGVSNVALAEATLKQKPKLLTKRMFKVGDTMLISPPSTLPPRKRRQRLRFGY
jgi:hypothetical protein